VTITKLSIKRLGKIHFEIYFAIKHCSGKAKKCQETFPVNGEKTRKYWGRECQFIPFFTVNIIDMAHCGLFAIYVMLYWF
jgi:hypothetical protein